MSANSMPTFMKNLSSVVTVLNPTAKELKKKMTAKSKRTEQFNQSMKRIDIEQQTIGDEIATLMTSASKEKAKQANLIVKDLANKEAKLAKSIAKEQAKEDAKLAKEDAKLAKAQAKEQAKLAKEQAKLAKEQAKLAKTQTKEEAKLANAQTMSNDREDIIQSLIDQIEPCSEVTV